MVHPTRKDRRLVPIIAGISLVLVIFGLVFLLVVQDVLAGLLFLGLGLAIWWPFLATHYEITATDLVIVHGPVRSRIPVADIVEVFPIHDAVAGPSAVRDRLRLNYQRAQRLVFVLLSPADPDAFLRELTDRVPGLHVSDQQAVRDGR